MKPRIISEDEFAAMAKTVQGNRKGSGAGGNPTVSPVRRTSESLVRHSPFAPYRSKWEAAYAAKLELEKQAGVIRQYWYEPFSLWLPGKVRYKPDFLVEYPYRLEMVEIKGWSRNRRDGITRLKIAAALFPCFAWILAYKVKGGGWEEETL